MSDYIYRIVRINESYFVEYKYTGSWWSALFYCRPKYWRRCTNLPVDDLATAERWMENCKKKIEPNVEIIQGNSLNA